MAKLQAGGGGGGGTDKEQESRPEVKFNYVGDGRDGETFLKLKYSQPSVSVKTQANYTEHDVFGDVTVRQKLGEKPDEISLDGVCTIEEANKVDELVYEEVVELVSNRWSGVVHIASTSTDPIDDGGGVDLDGEWLYTLTIEAVEITETFNNATDMGISEIIDVPPKINSESGSDTKVDDDYGSPEPSTTAESTADSKLAVDAYRPALELTTYNDGTQEASFSGALDAYKLDVPVDVYFEYRKKGASAWTQTSKESLSEQESFQIAASGISERDDYEYRAVAIATFDDGSTETAESGIKEFTSGYTTHEKDFSKVDTLEATNVSVGNATLEGEVTDMVGVDEVTAYFEYREADSDTWNKTALRQTLTSPGKYDESIDVDGGSDTMEYRAIIEVENSVSDYTGNTVDRGDKVGFIA